MKNRFRQFYEDDFVGRGGGRGRGRFSPSDNPDAPGSGPGGVCVCSSCGHEEKHTRAVACNKKKCPKCGQLMTKKN